MPAIGGFGFEGFGGNGLQTLDFQEFRHTIDAAGLADGLHLDGDSPRAVAPLMLPEDVADYGHELAISFRSGGFNFGQPGVIARAADVEGVAHGGQSECSLKGELFDEGIGIGY